MWETSRWRSAFPSRGGAAIVQAEGKVYLFGGANREQESLNDMWTMTMDASGTRGDWTEMRCTGDIPTPRSGHCMVYYRGCVLLHGGHDFKEQCTYNDIYCFRIHTGVWSYVGEAGDEVRPRNSHSLSLLAQGETTYLVGFGGAESEHGPMGDTFIALLPVDIQDGFFVHWEVLSLAVHPSPREMHAAAYKGSSVIITGGKNETCVLGDAWRLTLYVSPLPPAVFISTSGHGFSWTRLASLELEGVCAHASVLVGERLILLGGFDGRALSDAVYLSSMAGEPWTRVEIDGLPALFGHCALGMQGTAEGREGKEGSTVLVAGGLGLDPDYSDTIAIHIN